MSISSISSPTGPQFGDDVKQPETFRNEFRDLAQALDSGDLAGAQSAFGSLQQLQSTKQTSSSKNDGTLKTDFDNVGKALQSGDVKAAQTALATLRQDARKVHGGHRHHKSAKPKAATPTVPSTGATETIDPAPILGDLGQSVNAIA